MTGAEETTKPSSLGRDASVRLTADVTTLVMGFAGALVTARVLGPAGKGTLAVLAFLGGLLGQLGTLGLGEATLVWFGRRRVSLQTALSAVIPAVFGASLIGAVVLLGVGLLTIEGGANVHTALLFACVSVLVSSALTTWSYVVNAIGNFGLTSLAIASASVATTVMTFLLVLVIRLDVLGAVLATLFGSLVGCTIVVVRIGRVGLRLSPRLNAGFLREAVPYGLRAVTAAAFILMAGRLDVFLAYLLAGQAAAGQYSVALTVAAIAGMAPFALSYVAFPRLASESDRAAFELATRACRTATLLAALVAGGLAVSAFGLIPFLFGRAYTAAGPVTLLLLLGSVISSAQWVLARAISARGRAGTSAMSYGVTVVVMTSVDFALIPPLGIIGAGAGWCLATTAGLAVCLWHFAREHGAHSLRLFIPRPNDVGETYRAILRLVRSVIALRLSGPETAR